MRSGYTPIVPNPTRAVSASKPIPRKLKQDAIIEAIFEMRFDTGMIPEILFGRLAEYDGWKGLEQQRLPSYDIPRQLREFDPTLRFAPVFELRVGIGHRAIRIATPLLAYHQLATSDR